MSELGSTVDSLRLTVQDSASNFAAEARTTRQIGERMDGIREQINKTQQLVNQVIEASDELLRMLVVEKNIDEAAESSIKQRAVIAANLRQVTGELLGDSGNQHALDALADLEKAKEEAERSTSLTSSAFQEVNSALESALTFREGIDALSVGTVIIRNLIERVPLWSRRASESAEGAARHSMAAVEDLIAYQNDVD